MKNLKNLMMVMLMMASVFFFSCSKDEDQTLSPTEAKTELNNLGTDMSDYMAQMEEAEGIVIMQNLMNMPDPFVNSKSTAKTDVFSNMTRFLLPTQSEKTKSAYNITQFDFDTYKGVYTYHNSPFAYWEIVPGGNVIELNFPSDTAHMDVNDATLTLRNYTEISITDGTDTWYNPTVILGDLYVNDIKIVAIDLNAAWNTTGDNVGDPTSLDISVYLYPFEFTGNFAMGGTSASINFAIKYEDAQIFSAGVGALFETSTEESPINVNGYIQLMKVKFQASVDVKAIEEMMAAVDNQTSPYTTTEELLAALNAKIDAYVTVDGVKAADIEVAMPTANTQADLPIDIMFVYSDGTSESAIPYFNDFAVDLQNFFGFLDGVYMNW